MKHEVLICVVMICAYLLGNISPATIIAKAAGINIKKEGSGNAGTTNVLRTVGKKAALITLVIDVGKGYLAVLLAGVFLPWNIAVISAVFVFAGHVWPVFLKFQGGKGVATAFGAIIAVNWIMALICLAIVVIIVLITRMVSLGAISAAVCFPFLSFFMEPYFCLVGSLMALILIYKHKENIKRLIKGEENKISFGKKK